MGPQEQPQGIKNPTHKAHTIAAFVILVLFAAAIGVGSWYYLSTQSTDSYQSLLSFKKNEKKTETNSNSGQQDVVVIGSVIDEFEKAQKSKDAKTALSLFTPVVTKDEKDTYDFLTGKDIPPGGSYRLYGTNALSFELLSSQVVSNKKTGDDYQFVVSENRSVYNNVSTTWSSRVNNKVFIMKKVGSTWLIEQYYNQPAKLPSSPVKYEGFYS